MDDTMKFNSINDLYIRIKPALTTKIDELKREKVNYITEKDIFNYCISFKWKNKKDLRIYEIVDDILNVDVIDIEKYFNLNKNKGGNK